MAGVRIQVDSAELRALQKELVGLVGRVQRPRLAMLEIAECLHERSRENFDNEQEPDGTPWAALSPRYKKQKARQGVSVNKILHRSLKLRDHIFPFWSDTEAGISTAGEAKSVSHIYGNGRCKYCSDFSDVRLIRIAPAYEY